MQRNLRRVQVRRFQSTPSPRRATLPVYNTLQLQGQFQSTPSPRRATPNLTQLCTCLEIFQSTPSPRRATECRIYSIIIRLYFNPRPPRGGRRALCTPPIGVCINFNPRPPRGGRPLSVASRLSGKIISIHALPAEGDFILNAAARTSTSFQSTPSPRRATYYPLDFIKQRSISIHALPAEGDLPEKMPHRTFMVISIHALPAEGDHHPGQDGQKRLVISIHALPAEGDPGDGLAGRPHRDFNPRPPRGGRLGSEILLYF